MCSTARVFIERTLSPLVRRFPGSRWRSSTSPPRRRRSSCARSGSHVAATVTATICCSTTNAIFAGGIRPHHYCLPVLKREPPRGADRRGHLGQRAFSLAPTPHRMRAAPRKRLRLRRLLPTRARGHRALRRGLRRRRRARSPRGLRQPQRPGLYGLAPSSDTITLRRGESLERAGELPYLGEDPLVPLVRRRAGGLEAGGRGLRWASACETGARDARRAHVDPPGWRPRRAGARRAAVSPPSVCSPCWRVARTAPPPT